MSLSDELATGLAVLLICFGCLLLLFGGIAAGCYLHERFRDPPQICTNICYPDQRVQK